MSDILSNLPKVKEFYQKVERPIIYFILVVLVILEISSHLFSPLKGYIEKFDGFFIFLMLLLIFRYVVAHLEIISEKITLNSPSPMKKKLPLTIVVGDRRERPPQTPGDFFAHTSSSRDLTWIFSLGLSQYSVLWNDKIISATADDSEVPDYLKTRHLLIIGSPFCNLMTRKLNNSIFFRFNIKRNVLREINQEEDNNRGLTRNADELKKELSKLSNRHDEWVMQLRGLGFIDPIRGQLHAGAFAGHEDDYATISFCKHPYSNEHYAIVVAGLHLPGTMAGVKTLAEPEFFKGRPLGGIVKIEIPHGNWYEKLTRSTTKWFTSEYTIDNFKEKIDTKSSLVLGGNIFDNTDIKTYSELLEKYRDISLQDFLTSCIQRNQL